MMSDVNRVLARLLVAAFVVAIVIATPGVAQENNAASATQAPENPVSAEEPASRDGIQMYEGPPLPPDQEVKLQGTPPRRTTFATVFGGNTQTQMWIARVDGKSPVVQLGVINAATASVRLTPGKHTVRIRWRHRNYTAEGDVWFVGDPGRTYYTRAREAGDGTVQLWIVDDTGKRVGGIPGSADEPR